MIPTQECYKLFWRNSESHTTRNNTYTVTYISKTIQVSPTNHVRHSWRRKDELMGFSSMDPNTWMCQYCLISKNSLTPALCESQDVVWKTSRERWMIRTNEEIEKERETERERDRERELISEKSVLSGQLDDVYIYI